MSLLSESLRTKLIPWAQFHPERRVIVSSSRMRASEMPDGDQLTRRKFIGKRVIVKNRRFYNNTRSFLALWPEDRLNEVEHLKMVCVLSGHTHFQVGEKVISCNAGHFILLPAGIPHTDSSKYTQSEKLPMEDCEHLYIILHSNTIQCWIKRFQREQKRIDELENSLVPDDHVTQLFRILMEKATSGDSASLQHSLALLPIFFETLQKEIKEGSYVHPGTTEQDQIPTSSPLTFEQQLRQYIIRHIGKTLTVKDVAREMYFSRAQFSRRVRQETGKTFVEILTECRLEEAKVLLCKSEWTINAIAATVGFKAPAYFRRIFRQHTGMTPGEFRKNNSTKMR
jgi:AraC-like DNA-binding protein